ncbi:hypothetical protein ABE288_14000 [Bacillus salipaludis]|uniref:hypothetical protein n=1 Tax=Bacillus salipaludis TaxID=2547811 RepID=UPI003D222039
MKKWSWLFSFLLLAGVLLVGCNTEKKEKEASAQVKVGTLKPDHNGNGLISYRLPENYLFDDIGITLEPNPHNTQPKGEKVMGTS